MSLSFLCLRNICLFTALPSPYSIDFLHNLVIKLTLCYPLAFLSSICPVSFIFSKSSFLFLILHWLTVLLIYTLSNVLYKSGLMPNLVYLNKSLHHFKKEIKKLRSSETELEKQFAAGTKKSLICNIDSKIVPLPKLQRN